MVVLANTGRSKYHAWPTSKTSPTSLPNASIVAGRRCCTISPQQPSPCAQPSIFAQHLPRAAAPGVVPPKCVSTLPPGLLQSPVFFGGINRGEFQAFDNHFVLILNQDTGTFALYSFYLYLQSVLKDSRRTLAHTVFATCTSSSV